MSKPTSKSKKSETQNPATAEDTAPIKPKGSHPGKKILSIAISPSLHAKLALLARAEGRSVTDLCIEAFSKNLKGRLNSALDALRAEAEADLDK